MVCPVHFICISAIVLGLAGGCGPSRISSPSADDAAAQQLRVMLGSTAASGNSSGDLTSAESTGTGWGSLSGRFVFTGTPPETKALLIDKDTEICSKDGRKSLDRSLLVDASTKGLANVVLFVRKVSRVKEPSETVAASAAVFDQKWCEFLSPVFSAKVGQAVDVRNSDPIGHNTNISGSSFNQLIPAGQGTTYTPDRETGMPSMVICNIHPWMKAYVLFRKDGYAAISGTDGSFRIQNLPAEELLEFQVWHERSTGPNGSLGLEKPELKWTKKGRFQIKLVPDEEKNLGDIEVPAGVLGG